MVIIIKIISLKKELLKVEECYWNEMQMLKKYASKEKLLVLV